MIYIQDSRNQSMSQTQIMNVNPTSKFSYICQFCKQGIDGDVEGVANYPQETRLPLHDECHDFLSKHPNYWR